MAETARAVADIHIEPSFDVLRDGCWAHQSVGHRLCSRQGSLMLIEGNRGNYMADKEIADILHDADDGVAGAREAWIKPEIVDFQPVTVARGISYRIGDGFSNLS